MPDRSEKLAHLFPSGITTQRPFTAPGSPRNRPLTPPYPMRADPAAHVRGLVRELQTVAGDVTRLSADRQTALVDDCSGVFVDVMFVPNVAFPLKSLTDERPRDQNAHIELVAVTDLRPGLAQATLFVPDGRLGALERKIQAFAPTDSAKQPGNKALVSSLESIRRSVARSFWTDPSAPFPAGASEFWWEIWLRCGIDATRFRRHAKILGLHVSSRELRFPDRTVLLARATVRNMTRSAELLDSIAELRSAPPLDLEFLPLDVQDEREVASDLAHRAVRAHAAAMSVCVLDTGVDFEHPLLRAAPFGR